MIFTGEILVVSKAARDRREPMATSIEVTPGRVYVRASLLRSTFPSCRPLLLSVSLNFTPSLPSLCLSNHQSSSSSPFLFLLSHFPSSPVHVAGPVTHITNETAPRKSNSPRVAMLGDHPPARVHCQQTRHKIKQNTSTSDFFYCHLQHWYGDRFPRYDYFATIFYLFVTLCSRLLLSRYSRSNSYYSCVYSAYATNLRATFLLRRSTTNWRRTSWPCRHEGARQASLCLGRQPTNQRASSALLSLSRVPRTVGCLVPACCANAAFSALLRPQFSTYNFFLRNTDGHDNSIPNIQSLCRIFAIELWISNKRANNKNLLHCAA